LGGFHVVGVGGTYDGVSFDVPSGAMPHSVREELWKDRSLIGALVVYKYFPLGSDTRPRHPIFKAFRPVDDLDGV
jgi:hypothetical protein